jgi:hypothetical protein
MKHRFQILETRSRSYGYEQCYILRHYAVQSVENHVAFRKDETLPPDSC